jgi:hypothetical protein
VAALACGAALIATLRLFKRPVVLTRTGAARLVLYGAVFYLATLCLQPFLDQAIASFGAITLSLMAVGLGAGIVRPSRAHRFVTGACLALLGGELFLQVIAWTRPSALLSQWGSDAGQYVDRIRNPRGYGGAGGFPYNSWGDYEYEPVAKRPGECLVVSIGDSFSASTVPLPLHHTKVAERALGCRVYNAGVARIGPREYKYILQRFALALDPDLIVVDLFLGNDIVDDHGCNPSPLRFWLDRENLLLYAVPKRLVKGLVPPPNQYPVPPLDQAEMKWPWLADPTREPRGNTEEGYFAIEQAHVIQLCSPEAERYYPDFFTALDEIIAAARGRKLAFMLIPDELQVDDPVWRELVGRNAGVALERDKPQRVVGDWLKARGVPTLDLLPVLRAAPRYGDGQPHLYVFRDTHFNRRGYQFTGQALAEFARGLLHK